MSKHLFFLNIVSKIQEETINLSSLQSSTLQSKIKQLLSSGKSHNFFPLLITEHLQDNVVLCHTLSNIQNLGSRAALMHLCRCYKMPEIRQFLNNIYIVFKVLEIKEAVCSTSSQDTNFASKMTPGMPWLCKIWKIQTLFKSFCKH